MTNMMVFFKLQNEFESWYDLVASGSTHLRDIRAQPDCISYGAGCTTARIAAIACEGIVERAGGARRDGTQGTFFSAALSRSLS